MSGCSNIFMKSDNQTILSLWKKKYIRDMEIKKYIDRSQIKMKRVVKTIEALPKKIIVWRAGALIQRLLKTTNIRKNIFKFVDSNDNLIGKQIEGIEIISPDDVVQYNYPILIASYWFKDEIREIVKKKLLKNRIITF